MDWKIGQKRLFGHIHFVFILLIIAVSLVDCRTVYYCNAGPTENIPVANSRVYFRTFSLNNYASPSLLKISVDSEFCEALHYYGKYKDFQRDTSLWYWSICLYHSGRDSAPDSHISMDSVKLAFEGSTLEIPFTPLCRESHREGYNTVLCLDPIPLPKEFQGSIRVRFLLTMVDRAGVTLVDRRPTELLADCWKGHESDFWPGK